MASARFNLKSGGDPDSERLIYLNYSYSGYRLKYSTGLKITRDNWNPEKQVVREVNKPGLQTLKSYNQFLRQLAYKAEQIRVEWSSQGKTITPDELRAELDKYTGRFQASKANGLIPFIEKFIQNRSDSPKYRPESVKVYRSMLSKLKGFVKTTGKSSLDYKDITYEFWIAFRDYLYKLQLSENTVHKHITTLKTILKAAEESSAGEDQIEVTYMLPQTRKIGVSKETVNKIYLNQDELKSLHDLNLEVNSRLGRVRDLFLIGAYTGLRFSDFTRIQSDHFENLHGKEVIRIDTQKTGERVIIPVHPYVKEILDKYNGLLPKGISNQRMNEYLKELGELAQFDQPFILTKKVGGIKSTTTYKKYELLCTHTARRSFATNAYKSGVPSIAIMAITGHRTEASFMRYIQVSKEENALILAEHAFFN